MSAVATTGAHAFRFKKSDDVHSSVQDGVLRVTIDRPEKRNPLSLGVLERIREIFTGHAGDESIATAVLTGSGNKAFASGGDLKELAAYRTLDEARAFSLHGKAALDAVRNFPVPVIARINGIALGGGAELALACDQRLAAVSARIGFIHGRLNIAPSWGGGNDLIGLVGPARAIRLLTTALILEANAAKEIGIFDAVAPGDADFDDWFATQLAAIRANPPQVMRAIKSLALAGRPINRAEADQAETACFEKVWVHDDHWQAVAAIEKGP